MKKNIIILLSFLLAQSSFAGVLAEVVHSGGFTTRFAPAEHLQISDQGVVTLVRGEVHKAVAKLSDLSLNKLKALILELPDVSNLVYDEPNAIECMNTSSTLYKVQKSHGTELIIAKYINCRMMHIQIGELQQNVDEIESVLRGLDSVAVLVK